MASNKILTIEFKPKGDRDLIDAIKQLNRVTKQLQKTSGNYKNQIEGVNRSQKKLNNTQKKYSKGGITAVKHNRLLSHSLATLRSRLLIVAFGAALVTKAFKTMFDATIKQEKAEKKLEAALGKVNTALLHQASSLQKVTEFGDEAVIEVQALIGAFTKDEEQIKSLTVATLDLASAKGMDLKAAADLVAKSFGSSTNSLSRYGVEVVGAVGSSQRLESLTGNIAELFGGQARAAADTLGGSVQQMSNAFGDANEAIGLAFAPTIKAVTKLLTSAAQGAREFFLGFAEDPLETSIRHIEELGGDATELKKKLLESQKIDLERGIKFMPEHLNSSKEILDAIVGQEQVVIDRLKKQEDARESLRQQGHDIAELEEQANMTINRGMSAYQTGLTNLQMSQKANAKELLKSADYWGELVEKGRKGVENNAELLQIAVEYEKLLAKMAALEPEEEEGFFAKLFGKFADHDEMEILVENVSKVINAISDVGNAYDKVKMQQINQAKQAELDTVKNIRNERIRTKAVEEIEAKYAEKTRKHKEKMKDVKIAEAISNTALGITAAWDEPFPLNVMLAGLIAASGALQISTIKAQKYQYGGAVGGRRHSQGGTMIEAEQGEFVVSRPGVEAVGIEALNRINAGAGGVGGSSIIINNPIIGKDTIEDEIVPQIKEALRRGGDIGI